MMECKMSSAGLWPTLARRCLLSQDDWALSPVRTFSKPKTAPGHRPFPARHTIPFQVWRRFPQAADSATDWQALLRCQCSGDDGLPVAVPAEQHCSALRRRYEVLGTSPCRSRRVRLPFRVQVRLPFKSRFRVKVRRRVVLGLVSADCSGPPAAGKGRSPPEARRRAGRLQR